MLYYLFRYLGEFGVSGANLWHYISFRAVLTLVLSLLISMWFGQYFIKWMKAHKGSEAQRDASIDPYGVEKKGVPTMGGIIIIVATLIPCLLLGRLRNIYMLLMLFTTVWLGALGFADDYIKMKVTKNGLRPIYKLIGQAVLGLVIGLTLTFVHLVGIGLTGCSVNPARSLGSAITAAAGGNTEPMSCVIVFIAAPLVGAGIAALFYSYLEKE